jgi:hypothetical protein
MVLIYDIIQLVISDYSEFPDGVGMASAILICERMDGFSCKQSTQGWIVLHTKIV